MQQGICILHTQKLIFLSGGGGGGRGGGHWGIPVVNARMDPYLNAVYLIVGRNVLLNKQIQTDVLHCGGTLVGYLFCRISHTKATFHVEQAGTGKNKETR